MSEYDNYYCNQCGKEFNEDKHIHYHNAKGKHWFVLTIWHKEYLICNKCINFLDLTIYSNSEPQNKKIHLSAITNNISKEWTIEKLKDVKRGLRHKAKVRRSFIEYNKLDFNKKHEANAVELFQRFGDFFDILNQFKDNFNEYHIDDGKNITNILFSAMAKKIIDLCQEYDIQYEELFKSLNRGYRICKSIKKIKRV